MSRRNRRYVLGLTFVVLVAVAGALIYKFLVYQKAGLDGLPNEPQASVVITMPHAYSQAPQGMAIPVSVSANGVQPLTSTELWVNGKLMGVQAAPPTGQLMFDTTFLWFSGASGEFSLVASSTDIKGVTSFSPAVLIKILPHVDAQGANNQAAFDAGAAMVLPAVPGGAGGGGLPPVSPPGPNEKSGPAQAGSPSLSDWITNLTDSQPPKAPELALTVKGCAVTLSIHDLSNNEEGFQVFRSTDHSPAWQQIKTLNSQSALDWITTEDTLQGAVQASYYVAAVNKLGQAKSNLATASFSAADCPPVPGDQQALSVDPVSFSTDIPVDQAYCYESVNNASWGRWPETGFFLPGTDGFNMQKYKQAFAVNGLDGKPILKTFDLRLECWGWAGGSLMFLGEAHFSNDVSNLRPQVEARGANFVLKFNFGLGTGMFPGGNFDTPIPLKSGQMPYIFAFLSYDPKACEENLPSKDQNFIGGLFYCHPIGGYQTVGTKNPQPFLIWAVSDSMCPNGQGADCKFLPQIKAMAQTVGANLYFNINIDENDGFPHNVISPISQTAYVIPPTQTPGQLCFGENALMVSLVFEDISNGKDNAISSLNSNVVKVPCYLNPNIPVKVDVSFYQLDLSNVNDGESAPQALELYGFFNANSSDGSHGSLEAQYYPNTGCPNDNFGGFSSNGTINCWKLPDGNFRLGPVFDQPGNDTPIGTLPLCVSEAGNCLNQNGTMYFPYINNNNTIHLTVGDGDNISLAVMLTDYDSASADDPACFAVITTAGKSLVDWSNTDDNYVLHQDDNGNAACNVNVQIYTVP